MHYCSSRISTKRRLPQTRKIDFGAISLDSFWLSIVIALNKLLLAGYLINSIKKKKEAKKEKEKKKIA